MNYLYWVTTEDHDEDWFIVASSAEEASKFHQDAEGYDPGDAFAEEIMGIPENIPTKTGWPTEELLVSVGAKFISNPSARIVEIDGRKFCEGLLAGTIDELNDDIFEEMGYGRPNETQGK